MRLLLFILLSISFINCNEVTGQSKKNNPISKEFSDYWYAGDAELSRYELEQGRYGETHQGEAVLIFVTEDFLSDKQVKFEGGEKNGKVKPILKLNFTKKFFTGIYPYSLMSSIFTPITDDQKTYKVSTSSQEWCGHTFTQLNHRKGKYEGKLFSYFMSEGDQDFSIKDALLEDEIWTKIRLNPSSLPTGSIELIPGTLFLRLKHREYKVEQATASIKATSNASLSEKPLKTYKVEYQSFNRTLEITFEDEFPYRIVSWTETNKSGFGSNAKVITTKATLTHQIKNAYWGKHDVSDAALRKELGLNMSNY